MRGAAYLLKTQDGGHCCIVSKLYTFGYIVGDFDATPSHFRGRKKIAEAACIAGLAVRFGLYHNVSKGATSLSGNRARLPRAAR